jgi:hypothetical protein
VGQSGQASNDPDIYIRRQWSDWRIAKTKLSKLSDLKWDYISGGVNVPAPQYFVHAYIWCDEYEGELAHSCEHGDAPHSIKVCVVKKDNISTFEKIHEIVGPKPVYVSRRYLRKILDRKSYMVRKKKT